MKTGLPASEPTSGTGRQGKPQYSIVAQCLVGGEGRGRTTPAWAQAPDVGKWQGHYADIILRNNYSQNPNWWAWAAEKEKALLEARECGQFYPTPLQQKIVVWVGRMGQDPIYWTLFWWLLVRQPFSQGLFLGDRKWTWQVKNNYRLDHDMKKMACVFWKFLSQWHVHGRKIPWTSDSGETWERLTWKRRRPQQYYYCGKHAVIDWWLEHDMPNLTEKEDNCKYQMPLFCVCLPPETGGGPWRRDVTWAVSHYPKHLQPSPPDLSQWAVWLNLWQDRRRQGWTVENWKKRRKFYWQFRGHYSGWKMTGDVEDRSLPG